MSPAMQQDLRATNAVFEQEVAGKRNVAALDRVYTANARILPPGGEMVTGRENIKTFWKGAIEAMNVATLRLEMVDFEMKGDTGIEIGRATIGFAAADQPAATVKYVVIWKQEEGVWKWHVDIWNASA